MFNFLKFLSCFLKHFMYALEYNNSMKGEQINNKSGSKHKDIKAIIRLWLENNSPDAEQRWTILSKQTNKQTQQQQQLSFLYLGREIVQILELGFYTNISSENRQ